MAISKVGPWAAKKLERLQKYLNAYTTILRKQSFEGFYYIDAFAGGGASEVREPKRSDTRSENLLFDVASYRQEQPEQLDVLAGSPRIALELKHPFSGYVFIEKDRKRIAELEALKSEFEGTRRIGIREADCNQFLLEKVATKPEEYWKRNRALVFLDPFGMDVPWKTIEALGRTRAIEIFLNFPVGMAIQRLLFRDAERFTDKRRSMLNDYFGCTEWYDIVYKEYPGLGGETVAKKLDHSGSVIFHWYRDRLEEIFGHASDAALIRNTRGAHLYYLLLASPNGTGVNIFNKIIAKAGEVV